MHNFLRFFTLLIALGLVGCGATLPKIKPYKMDIQQGNVVTSKMLLKLRPGMTKSQVKFIMGTPLLIDSFRTNRWDYFYQLRQQGKIVNQRRVILDFENDLLKGVRGDVVPKGTTAEDVAKKLEAEPGRKDAAATPASTEPASEDLDIVPSAEPELESSEVVPDAVEPGLVPTEDAVIEGADDNGEAAPASVLAVPIPVVPAIDSSASPEVDTLPEKAEETLEETSKEEMPSASVVVPEKKLAPAIEQETEMLKEEPAEEPDAAIEPIQKEVPVASSPASAHSDNKRVFRLDHELDTSRINQGKNAVPETSSQAPSQDSVVKEIKENPDSSLLDEEEPSFFKRMLEKVGF